LGVVTDTGHIRSLDFSILGPTGYNQSPALDNFSYGTYQPVPTITNVDGAVTGMSPTSGTVTCRNLTTKRAVRIAIQAEAESWDCERAGLGVTAGDTIQLQLTVNGASDAVPSEDLGFVVTGMSPQMGTVTCQNLTIRKTVRIAIRDGVRSWDCEQAGLAVNAGDRIRMSATVKGPADP
jgi:hypothetical protein